MREKKYIPFWTKEENKVDKNILSIILLAHVQQPRGYINNSQLQCSETERFSIEEFNEIYQGIVTAGYYIQSVYYNELDFISDFIEHPTRFQNCLIYNLARNRLGDNKKTMIPAFCELVGLNYSTSSSLACALCRNKYYFTTLFRSHNISAPKSWLLSSEGSWINGAPEEGIQVICKPCSESASQGVHESGIFYASPEKFKQFYGVTCIVQEYIDGEECEVPVFKIGNSIKILPPVGINLGKRKILDEQSSAENSYDFYCLSDTQSQQTIDQICNYAQEAFHLMQMNVYGRIDFRINSYGKPYIFDVSTTPYTTRHSSFAFAFDQMQFQYSDIYHAIITAAVHRLKQ